MDGWAKVPNDLARDPSLSDKAFRLWVVLKTYADSEGVAFPSLESLAAEMSCHIGTVRRSRLELEHAGLLNFKRRRNRPGLWTLSPKRAALRDNKRAPVREKEPLSRISATVNAQPCADYRAPERANPPAYKEELDPINKTQLTRSFAIALTNLAFEQEIKPTASRQKAQEIINAVLQAGHKPKAVEQAIRLGGVSWSVKGLEYAVNQLRPRRNHKDAGILAVYDKLEGMQNGHSGDPRSVGVVPGNVAQCPGPGG